MPAPAKTARAHNDEVVDAHNDTVNSRRYAFDFAYADDIVAVDVACDDDAEHDDGYGDRTMCATVIRQRVSKLTKPGWTP